MTRIPLHPANRREVKLLEAALLVSAVLDPEIESLIRDPLEGSAWLESLAAAAEAKALEAAGLSPEEAARESGRSLLSVEAHLSGRTKAGRLVLKAYERLSAGEEPDPLRLHRCCTEAEALREENRRLVEQLSGCEELRREAEKLKKLHEEARGLENRLKELDEELRGCRERLEAVRRAVCSE